MCKSDDKFTNVGELDAVVKGLNLAVKWGIKNVVLITDSVAVLFDNSSSFRSQILEELCSRWSVLRKFRCAYRPSGNGIIERNHRTIKRMAARTGKAPTLMTFWYNSAPFADDDIPSSLLYRYNQRNPAVSTASQDNRGTFGGCTVSESVYIKPERAKCTTWSKGTVTGLPSTTWVEVDGIPRHVVDCRLVPEVTVDASIAPVKVPQESVRPTSLASQLQIRLPAKLSNYDLTR